MLEGNQPQGKSLPHPAQHRGSLESIIIVTAQRFGVITEEWELTRDVSATILRKHCMTWLEGHGERLGSAPIGNLAEKYQ